MISILTDSCSDLSQDLIKRFDIHIVPLHVSLGEKSYRDGEEITRDELFEYVEKTGQLPKTSAVSVEEMKLFF
jgi:fatty acid-binding protein DegV